MIKSLTDIVFYFYLKQLVGHGNKCCRDCARELDGNGGETADAAAAHRNICPSDNERILKQEMLED